MKLISQNLSFGQPPKAPSTLVIEEYFGKKVYDHYRNLEDLEDEKVAAWFKQQGDYANSILNQIPGRKRLVDKQVEFDKRKSNSISFLTITYDDQYFYLKRLSGENVAKLYYRKGFNGKEVLLFDPKDFKPELGNTYLINYHCPDWDGTKVVISLTKNGEEVSEMIILDTKTQKLFPDLITNCWPSDSNGVSWLPDNSGFYYLHYPVIDPTSKLFLKDMKALVYIIGQDSKQLNEILSRSNNPELNVQPEDFPIICFEEQHQKYIFGKLSGAAAFSNAYYAKLDENPLNDYNWKPLYKKEDQVSTILVQGEDLVFLSGKNASNYKICKTPLNNPNIGEPTVLVAEKKDEVIKQLTITADGIFYVTMKNGVEAKLYQYDDGVEQQIKLPMNSGNAFLYSKGEKKSNLYITMAGWSSDACRYEYDAANGQFTPANISGTAEFPEYKDLVVKEVLVQSHDGVEVPLSIMYKEGLKMNGENPVLLYGYGAYGQTISPFFNPGLLLFTAEGGILAIAHVRGGGEKGVAWHEGGKKTTKPNTWKDLIACTEYMINEQYTSKDYTAIFGGSAAGVLIGRAMTERPDLFAVAIAKVAVLNALRFGNTPNGPNSAKEFGTTENEEECNALYEMDAYLHLEEGVSYPATLISAGMNDPRVIAWQPAKFVAKLQAYQQGERPILFHVDYESGHGIGDSQIKRYESRANVLAFIFWQTKHPDYQMEG